MADKILCVLAGYDKATEARLAAQFQAFQGKVTSLHLYEFWPTRHILSLPLCQ